MLDIYNHKQMSPFETQDIFQLIWQISSMAYFASWLQSGATTSYKGGVRTPLTHLSSAIYRSDNSICTC